MDRITGALVEAFTKEYGLEKQTQDKQFESLATHLLVGRAVGDNVEFSDLICGGGADLGIDSIGIIVNGQIISEAQEIEDIAKANGFLEVKFIFIQTETSEHFDGQKLGNFADGIKEFFAVQATQPRNDEIKSFASVMSKVYDMSDKFSRGNPVVQAYYVTAGTWAEDPHLEAKRATKEKELRDIGLFSTVELRYVDRARIQELYNASKNAVRRQFIFERKAVIPDIPGVKEAYIGILPATEFLKLVQDESGDIIKSIFYDNVRDWQDYNEVNTEIRGTLQDKDRQLRFSLMNNGVTIIAKVLRATANKFYIEDYQVVNGCQTSHVLQQNKDVLSQEIMVPLRIISTVDEEIITGIIKATNRQTEVSEEQLLAISDFQKQLEAFFPAFDGKKQLFYERRSRQYNHQNDVEKVRVISPTSLIRSFSSMYLHAPHRTLRSYKSLLATVGKELFVANHKLEPYYASAYAYYKLEYLFRNGILNAKYKVARFHLLMAVKLIHIGAESPPLNSRKTAANAKVLYQMLWDDDKATAAFQRAAKLVDKLTGAGKVERDDVHTEQFTDKLIAAATKLNKAQ